MVALIKSNMFISRARRYTSGVGSGTSARAGTPVRRTVPYPCIFFGPYSSLPLVAAYASQNKSAGAFFRTRLFILLTQVPQGLWQKSARGAVHVPRERNGSVAGSF